MGCFRLDFHTKTDMYQSILAASRPSTATRKPLESHFKTDDSGRLEISEEKVASSSKKNKHDGNANMEEDSMGAYLEAMRGEDGHMRDSKGKARFNKTQGKRGRGDEDEDDVDGGEGAGDAAVVSSTGSGRREKKARKETVRIGAEFKAKVCSLLSRRMTSTPLLTRISTSFSVQRAGGDIKKDGIAPYAYIPLSNVAGKNKGSRGPKVDFTGRKKGSKK